ncbi:hypothetical protein [Actinoplanes regularis]|uniref:hypothetical protein n=1 Tax=Actinoplanes regularis TaxID=52697 RepID=UPI00249FDA07|nr:hypothetical protein [Actinoplanes regularis]GLW30467.1 hypothetical protein Areg01_34070 [Actinoplanes regularis]
MLNGIDDIDWSALDGAYGPCTEAPSILRDIASPFPETADEGRYELLSSIWHQCSVYPATVAVVPFLIELATTPGVHRRDHLLHILGGLCDPEQVNGPARHEVRAAVAVHSGPLQAALADPDPQIRRSAAYAAAWSGPHFTDALHHLWATETHPGVRANLLPGLAMLDPVAAEPLLDAAFRDPAPQIRAAAALAVVLAGRPLPAAARASVADAFAHLDPDDNPWSGEGPGWDRIFTAAGADEAVDLATTMARAESADARTSLAYGLIVRFRSSRSATTGLLPALRTLLADADPQVRTAATQAALAAGEAAAPVADLLLSAAGHGDHGALEILIRLGHPGYAKPLLADEALGLLSGLRPPFDRDVLAAVRRRLAALPVAPARVSHATRPRDDRDDLLAVLSAWGPAAADAVPEIIAVLPDNSAMAARALTRILAPDPATAAPAVAALTELASRGDIRAGHAVLTLTGDPGPLVAAAAIRLEPGRRDTPSAHELDLVADAATAAAVLLPSLRRRLTGDAPERDHDERHSRVAAARVAWRATGDTQQVLPTLRAVLRAGFAPAGPAAALLAELGACGDLQPELRRLLTSEWYARNGAAVALHGLGIPADELAGPLISAVADGHASPRQQPFDPRNPVDPLDALVTIGAAGAAPALLRLATRDERIRVAHFDENCWSDDLLRHRLHAVAAALTARDPRRTRR